MCVIFYKHKSLSDSEKADLSLLYLVINYNTVELKDTLMITHRQQ